MIRFTFFLALASLLACKAGQGAGGSAPLVELRTGGCFGYCPTIRLTVHQNGFTEYEGIHFAQKMGLDSFRLTKAEARELRKKVEQVNLWQYPDRIKSEVADAPFMTLTAFKGAVSKSVVGSIDRPAPLLELEKQIKDLAEAHGYEVVRGVNPKEIPANRRREVLVKLQPEANAGNWIRQFSEFSFQLVRRVSQENLWIVAYDPEQVTEKAVIALFKGTPEVLEAQSNKPVQDRQ